MRAVILGASAGVGRALAEQLGATAAELFLVARDERDILIVANDLRLRFNIPVHVLAADLANPDTEMLSANISAMLGRIDALFMIAGITDPDDRGILADNALDLVAKANFLGPVRTINALLPLCSPGCHIVLAGSVATIRPRGGNTVYGAAKAGLEHFGMAIRHAFADRLGSVRCYRLGYIKTAMTFGQKLPLPAVTPQQVARKMLLDLGKSGVVYYPGWWKMVAVCLRAVPWFIFKKLRI